MFDAQSEPSGLINERKTFGLRRKGDFILLTVILFLVIAIGAGISGDIAADTQIDNLQGKKRLSSSQGKLLPNALIEQECLPHTRFQNPRSNVTEKPRESIEVRAYANYRKLKISKLNFTPVEYFKVMSTPVAVMIDYGFFQAW